MIFDLDRTPPPSNAPTYDVCIAGGGVAGITLALKLADLGHHVVLVEAGGQAYSARSQAIYKGPNIGRRYLDLDSARLRFLGGTANHWAGYCRPLDTQDFEIRDHIPLSGWPLNKTEIDPYLGAACRILEIGSEFANNPVQDSGDSLDLLKFRFSPPVRFGEKYLEALRSSKRIDVFLHANLVNIRLEPGNGRVARFECANYAEPAKHHGFTARMFVLALGGMENPRLLLNCRDQVPHGIGNERDLVGRFFMEHFHSHGGVCVAAKKVWPFGKDIFFLGTSKTLQKEHRITNCGLQVVPIAAARAPSLFGRIKFNGKRLLCANDVIRDFLFSLKRFSCPVGTGADPLPIDAAGIVRIVSEQAPNRQSRVLLANETDRFGLRRGALDWRATKLDRRSIKHGALVFGHYLAANGYGSVRIEEWLRSDHRPIPGVGEDQWMGAGWHHMGTTRMARPPHEGVVDRNCQVFTVGNLFIAGSSVFPTAGHSPPTLTIVQLALRLADHLHRTLATR